LRSDSLVAVLDLSSDSLVAVLDLSSDSLVAVLDPSSDSLGLLLSAATSGGCCFRLYGRHDHPRGKRIRLRA